MTRVAITVRHALTALLLAMASPAVATPRCETLDTLLAAALLISSSTQSDQEHRHQAAISVLLEQSRLRIAALEDPALRQDLAEVHVLLLGLDHVIGLAGTDREQFQPSADQLRAQLRTLWTDMGCRRGDSSGSQQAGGSTDIEGPIHRDETPVRAVPEPEDAEDPEEPIAAEAGLAGPNAAESTGAEARPAEQAPTPIRDLIEWFWPYALALVLAAFGVAAYLVLRKPRERAATRYVYAAPVILSDSSGRTTPSVFSNISTDGRADRDDASG